VVVFRHRQQPAAPGPFSFGKSGPANGAGGLQLCGQQHPTDLDWSSLDQRDAAYQVCLGSLPGDCDVLGWQSVGNG
jgi:hypothetical protein